MGGVGCHGLGNGIFGGQAWKFNPTAVMVEGFKGLKGFEASSRLKGYKGCQGFKGSKGLKGFKR